MNTLLSLLLAFGATGDEASLRAAAAATSRPPECAAIGRASSVWRDASARSLRVYCDALSRGSVRLDEDAEAALEFAGKADAEQRDRAAPLVLRARAELRLGRVKASLSNFAAALARDGRSLDAPAVAWDHAAALRRGGRFVDSLESYRRLIPLSALLPRRGDSIRVLLEAAHVSLAALRDRPTERLGEALNLLQAARRRAFGADYVEVALSLALVLDGAGQRQAADALLGELRGASSWSYWTDAAYLCAPEERLLLEALSLENKRPDEARARYAKYLENAAPSDLWRRTVVERSARLSEKQPPRHP